MLDLLKKIRKGPGMYLGSPSLIKLAFFLRGCDLSLLERGGAPGGFLPDFRDWIHRRFHTMQRSWEDAIRDHCQSDEEAFDRFWGVLDEFLEEQGRDSGNGAAASSKSGQTQTPVGGLHDSPRHSTGSES